MGTRYVEVTLEVDEEIGENERIQELLNNALTHGNPQAFKDLNAYVLDVVNVENSEQP